MIYLFCCSCSKLKRPHIVNSIYEDPAWKLKTEKEFFNAYNNKQYIDHEGSFLLPNKFWNIDFDNYIQIETFGQPTFYNKKNVMTNLI